MFVKAKAPISSRVRALLYGVMLFSFLADPIAIWAQAAPPGSNSDVSTTSPGQQATPSRSVRPLHIVPFGPPSRRQPRAQTSAGEPTLPYWGGPVISQIHVVE